MIGNSNRWEKLGRIIAPDPRIYWMSTYAGSAFARQVDETDHLFDIYIAGRDNANRSQIGRVRLNFNHPHELLEISVDPILGVGSLGAFDENGLTYPYLVQANGQTFMYYTGWMPSVLTPFQNQVGLAVQTDNGSFKRISRAPILSRTNEDYLSIGSVCVLNEPAHWRMWYTCFTDWWKEGAVLKHRYIIKYAESNDGLNWVRNNIVCIDSQHEDEFAICRPSVLKLDNHYHMWYSYRGDYYRIGYAHSVDGITWTRRDDLVGISLSEVGWDSISQSYAHVFQAGPDLYMIYNGNQYGKDGLGLARLRL